MGKKTQEVLQPPKVVYPEINFWSRRNAKRNPLRVINPGDFPRKSILASLGILDSPLVEGFGTSDPEEIKRRQKVVRYLVEHPELSKWLEHTYCPSPLPVHEDAFLRYFDPEREHSPYWQLVHDLVKFLSTGGPLPVNLKALLDVLKKSLVLEDYECQLGQVISERVKNIAVIEGIMSFGVAMEQESPFTPKSPWKITNLVLEKGSVHGHRMFSLSLTEAELRAYPSWARDKKSFRNSIGLGNLARWGVNRLNDRKRQKASQDMVITQATSGLISDIRSGLLKRFGRFTWMDPMLNKSQLNVYFSYSRKGLQLRIISWETEPFEPEVKFDFADFAGYSEKRIALIEQARQKLIKKATEQRMKIESGLLTARVERRSPEIFKAPFFVDSPYTDGEHRWFAISNLYDSVMLCSVVSALYRHREFFDEKAEGLRKIAFLANRLSQKARDLGSPLCWPELAPDGQNVVTFDEIYPLHLLGQLDKVKPVPIRSLAEINGNKMLGFTGTHGGGKTVASLTIVENISLAQSGLPVFGQGFYLNPKKIIGLVFVERGEGSTAEMLVGKIVNVVRGIRQVKGSQAVIVFDELGAGTQEAAGFKLGRDVLSKLNGLRDISIIFNTQIIPLAEFAENELGAKCLQLDEKHRILPGIGEGRMDQLRKRLGLDRLL
jgi:hypothetical protein